MSCTFWNMRRRNASRKQDEPVQMEIVPENEGVFTEIADGKAEAPQKKAKKSKVKSND